MDSRVDLTLSAAQEQASIFLELVVGPALTSDSSLVIWTLPDRATRRFHNCHEAATYAINMGQTMDAYFGTCAVRSGLKHGRGTFADMAGLAALRVDVDVAGEGHKTEALPPDKRTALALLDSIEPRPAVVVESGGGLHAYVLLNSPLLFDNDDERRAGQELLKRYELTVQTAFAKKGWHVDTVADLPRVLRVPGTMNHKHPDQPRPVVAHRIQDTPKYAISDLNGLLLPAPAKNDPPTRRPANDAEKHNGVRAARSRHQAPPQLLIDRLCEESTEFNATWNLQRSEFTKPGGSPDWSRYDQSLASLMAHALGGSDDGEDDTFGLIAGTILAFRTRHCTNAKDRDKALRSDYIDRTVGNAISAARDHTQDSPSVMPEHADPPLVWEDACDIEDITLRAVAADRRDRVRITAMRNGRAIASDIIGIASGRSREKLASKIATSVGAGDALRSLIEDWLLQVMQTYEHWQAQQRAVAVDPSRQLRRSGAKMGVEIGIPSRQWSNGEDHYLIAFDHVVVELTEADLDSFQNLNRKVRPYIKRSLQPLTAKEQFRFMSAAVASAVDRNEHSTEAAETLAWLTEDFVSEPCGSAGATFQADSGQPDRRSLADVIQHVRPRRRLPLETTVRPDTYESADADLTGYVWDSEGRLYLRVDAIISYLNHRKFIKITADEMKRRLGNLGFEAMENSRRHGDSRLWTKTEDGSIVKVSVWSSPAGFSSHFAGNADDAT